MAGEFSSKPRLPFHGIGKVGHRNVIYCGCVLSHVPLFVTLWTVARQAPLSMGFPRQGCWSGLPFPPPGHLPDPGIEPASLASPALAGGFFTTGATWEDSLSNVMLILIQKQTHFLPLPAPSPLSPASRGLILLPVT